MSQLPCCAVLCSARCCPSQVILKHPCLHHTCNDAGSHLLWLQDADLDSHLLLRYIAPAEDRKAPLILDLCLALPADTQAIALTAEFSKGFMTMFEYPPDAYRGFDIPAAIVSYMDQVSSNRVEWAVRGQQCGSSSKPGTHGSMLQSDICVIAPLLQQMSEAVPQQVSMTIIGLCVAGHVLY